MFRKLTLRRMRPHTRKVAKLCNELESINNRLRNLLQDIELLETTAKQSELSELHRDIDH